MKPTKHLITTLLAGALLFVIQSGLAQPTATPVPDDVRTYFEMLRSDFNATKIQTINQVMKLTGPEADVFWPIYRNYEKELAAVGDEKLALIRQFVAHHQGGTLNDQNAKTLAQKWLNNSQARLNLWKKYHKKLSKAVSAMRAAQFLQVENQMALFVDIGIASAMPEISPGLPQGPAR